MFSSLSYYINYYNYQISEYSCTYRGPYVGVALGDTVGELDCSSEGDKVEVTVGSTDGDEVTVGNSVGKMVGFSVGFEEGV